MNRFDPVNFKGSNNMIRFKPLAICTSLLATVLLTGAGSGRQVRTIARPTTSWTTNIGTFVQTPQPGDTSITAGLWAISPSGDSSVGITWQQSGPPFSKFANMVGYMTEDLARVYRAGFPTRPYGINDAGDVTGTYYDTTATGHNTPHGWLFHAGEYYRIDFPGSTRTFALGINNAGSIVGIYVISGITHQFVYENGAFTSFDLPDSFTACNATSTAINSTGAIAGKFQVCHGTIRGFIRAADGSTFTAFDATPDAISTGEVVGMNDRGDIVGGYFASDGKYHGFLRPGNGDPTIDIDFPGEPGATQANGIDKSGQIIVGIFGDLVGIRAHPFKLTLCGAHCGDPH